MIRAQDLFDIIPNLEEHYRFMDSQVAPFLEQHLLLVPILVKAHEIIADYFPNAPLGLNVYTDHEIPGWVTLNLVIGIEGTSNEDIDKAIKQLDRLDYDWWLDEMMLTDGKMRIGLGVV